MSKAMAKDEKERWEDFVDTERIYNPLNACLRRPREMYGNSRETK